MFVAHSKQSCIYSIMFSLQRSGLLQINSGALRVKELIKTLRETVDSLNNGQSPDLSNIIAALEDTSILTDNRITREILRIMLLTDNERCRQTSISYILRNHLHMDLDLSILVLFPLWAGEHRDSLMTFLSALSGNQQESSFLAVTNLLSYHAFRDSNCDPAYFLTRTIQTMNQSTITVNLIETSLLFEFANISENRPTRPPEASQGPTAKRVEPSFILMSPLFWQILELALYCVLEATVPGTSGLSTEYADSIYMPTFSLSYLTLQPARASEITKSTKIRAGKADEKDTQQLRLHLTGTKTIMNWADYISFWSPYLTKDKGDAMQGLVASLSSLISFSYRLLTHPQLYPDLVSPKQAERSIFFSLELLMVIASVCTRVFSLLPAGSSSGSVHRKSSLFNQASIHLVVLESLEKLGGALVSLAKRFPSSVPEAFTDCYNSVLVTIFRTLNKYLQWDRYAGAERVPGVCDTYLDTVRQLVTLLATFSPSLHIRAFQDIAALLKATLTSLPDSVRTARGFDSLIVMLYLIEFKHCCRMYAIDSLEQVLQDLTGICKESLVHQLNLQLFSVCIGEHNYLSSVLMDCIFPLDSGVFGRILNVLLKLHEDSHATKGPAKDNLHYMMLSILSYFNYGGICMQQASFQTAVDKVLCLCKQHLDSGGPEYLLSMYNLIQAVLQPGVYTVPERGETRKGTKETANGKAGGNMEINKSNCATSDSPVGTYASTVIDALIKNKTCDLQDVSKRDIKSQVSSIISTVYGKGSLPDRDSIHMLRLYVALQTKSKTDYPYLTPRLSRKAHYLVLKGSVAHPELILLCYEWRHIGSYAAWYSEKAACIATIGHTVFSYGDGTKVMENISTVLGYGPSLSTATVLNKGSLRIVKYIYALALEHPQLFRLPTEKLFVTMLQTTIQSPDVMPLNELLVYRTFTTALDAVGADVLRLLMYSGLPVDTLLTYYVSHFRDNPMLVAFCLIAAVYSLQAAPRPVRVRVPRTQGVMLAAAFLRKDQLELLRGIVKE